MQQTPPDALAAPDVRDRNCKLAALPIGRDRKACFADHGWRVAGIDFDDQRRLVAMIEMRDADKLGRRQFLDRAEKPVVSTWGRKRGDVGGDQAGIARAGGPHGDVLAACEPKGMDELRLVAPHGVRLLLTPPTAARGRRGRGSLRQ